MQTARQDFSKHERSLWGVLARLARSGYVVPPDEGRDLVHDFYVEAWAGLLERFDPARGKFETYMLGAFYQFARRRILNLRNWRARLADAGALSSLAAETPNPEERLQQRDEIREIRNALGKLPPLKRELLGEFLAEEGVGERELASRHGLSRYALRESMIDALGQVAASVVQLSRPGSSEAKVAAALWHEGRAVRDVAVHLDMPVAEVQKIRRRYGLGLMKALRSADSARTERSTPMNANPLQLLKQAILSAGREDVLGDLTRNAHAILEALNEGDIKFSAEEIAFIEQHPEWVAAVYQALEDRDEQNEIAEAILKARANEDAEIGAAFAQALGGLPEELRHVHWWFSGVSVVGEEYEAHLNDQTVVKAGLPFSEGLTRYGMSPATFQGATRGLELLFERVFGGALPSSRPVGAGGSLILSRSDKDSGPSVLARDLALAQIRGGPHCPPEAAGPLLDWLIEAASLRPYWFRGYRADPHHKGAITIERDTSNTYDLMARWSLARSAADTAATSGEIASAA